MISVLSIFLIAWVLPAVFGFGAPRVEAPRGGLVSSRSALFASEPAAKASRAAAAKTDKVPLRSTTQSLLKTMPSQIPKFIGKAAIVDVLRESTNLKRKDVEAVINGLEKLIVDSVIKSGTSVRLSKFGTFRLRKAAARTFRNPKTGEPGLSKAFKTMTFSASNKLRKY